MQLRLLLIVLLFSPFCKAQDWKTVNFQDTVYFTVEGGDDAGYLRAAIVDSINVANNDSNFYFLRAVRGVEGVSWGCLDTLAPGWLGRYFTRKSDGTELYFNMFGDTITLVTNAELNDSWTLAKSHDGSLEFLGKVIQKDTMSIDGTLDSVKTISIQAMQNGQPVSNDYNNKIFELSKDHGWLNTLDLFKFPDDTIGSSLSWLAPAPIINGNQHKRLPKSFNNFNIHALDLSWVYAPGNEWIYKTENRNYSVGSHSQTTLMHDSIIASNLINPGQIHLDLLRRECYLDYVMDNNWLFHLVQASGSSFNYSTTITAPTSITRVKEFVVPEYLPVAGEGPPLQYHAYSFCDRLILDVDFQNDIYYGYDFNDSCLAILLPSGGGYDYGDTYLQGFGRIGTHVTTNFQFPQTTSKYYPYLNIGGCTKGAKFDVIALGVEDATLSKDGVTIFPNPTTSHTTITTTKVLSNASIELYDMGGRQLFQSAFNGNTIDISTAHLSTGMYFITIKADGERVTKKLVVQQ